MKQNQVLRQDARALIVYDESEKTFRFNRGPVLNLKRISRHYNLMVWSQDQYEYLPHHSIMALEIEEGGVYLDGLPIINPKFDRSVLSWCQKTAEHFTSGVLQFTSDGLAFHGIIYNGPDENNAVSHPVGGAVPPTVYKSEVSRSASSESEWDLGVDITLGYEFKPGEELPTQIIKINKTDMKEYFATGLTDQGNLTLTKIFNPNDDAINYDKSPGWPASGKIEISWDGTTFAGTMKKFDPITCEESQTQFKWKGTAQKTGIMKIKTIRAATPMLMAISDLSLAELQSISPAGVPDRCFEMLIENMKWATNDTWRKEFFGVDQKPIISQDRIKIIEADKEFYTEKFAKAYLGWGLGNMPKEQGGPTNPLADRDRLNLEYYLYNGLGKEPGYNIQYQSLFIQSFIEKSPRLQEYIKDNGEGWADRLFKALTTYDAINRMINSFIAEPDKTIATINRYSDILSALQPSHELAKDYHSLICIKSLLHISDQVSWEDKKDIMEWLPDVIQDFITKYAHAPETTEIKEHVIAAKALEEAAQIAGGVSKLAEQMADAFMKTPDKLPFLKRMDAASDAFFKDFSKKYPKLSKVGGLFRFAFWTGGLYMAITGFMGWKNLSADKKAATILTTIAVFDQMIISIPEFLTKAALTGDIFKNIKQFLGKFEILKGLQRGVEAIDNSWVGSLAKNVGGFFDKARKAIVVEGTILSKVFRGLTTILKWLGAAIAVAFAALSIYQFIKDLQDGDIPVANKVFDAIIMGCDILMAVCTVIALFVTSVIIAIAAAVFAVLGVIFAIVQLFLPKPKSPIDKAWDDTLHPFIAALPDAPAGWTPGKLNFA